MAGDVLDFFCRHLIGIGPKRELRKRHSKSTTS